MTTRLTNHIRNQMLLALINKRFKSEEKALEDLKPAVGDEIYKLVFPEWRKMDRLPEGWLRRVSGLRFYDKGQARYVAFSRERPIPHDEPSELKGEAARLAREYEEKRAELKERRDTVTRQVRATLESFHTLDKLLKEWPEAKPFVPKELAPITSALAIPVASLNALLGLGR